MYMYVRKAFLDGLNRMWLKQLNLCLKGYKTSSEKEKFAGCQHFVYFSPNFQKPSTGLIIVWFPKQPFFLHVCKSLLKTLGTGEIAHNALSDGFFTLLGNFLPFS